MSEQPAKQPLRWLPWFAYSAPTAPRAPTRTQPQPAQPTTSARPPFRPAGVAPPPPRPSTQPQAPPRTEPQLPSPTRVASLPPSPKVPSQPQATMKNESRPPSPTQVVPQSRVTSQPPSLSQPIASQPQVLPKTASPARPAPKSRITSQPASPSKITTSQPPQAPKKTEPEPPSLIPTAPESRVTSQPSSPSQISEPKQGTQKTSQPTTPALTATKPERASQPPSPLHPTSQPDTKTFSVPPSPPPARKPSQPSSPSTKPPQSQTITQASPRPPSPTRTTVTQTEPPTNTMVESQAQPAMSKPELEYPPKREGHSEPGSQPQGQTKVPATYQSALVQKQQVESPPASNDRRHHPAPGITPDETEGDKAEATKEEKLMIPASEEPKQRTIPELINMASVPNERPRDLFNTTFKEEKQPPKKLIRDDKEILGTSTGGKERKTVIPINQIGKRESSEHLPKYVVPHGDHLPLHKEIKDDISKFVHKLSSESPKHSADESSVSVITLAGENRGASMHLDPNTEKREGSIHIHRGYKLNQDGNDATTDGESSSKDKRPSDAATRENPASMVFLNSNTQSINNSIIFNSSINEGSPGVHFVFSPNPKEADKSNAKPESVQARKADFNVTQSEKLTYEPTIRRRCLRGLFSEPTDSDPENPDKPRRHGCRYSCDEKKKSKDNGNDV